VAGRIKQFGRFVMLVPKELDPASTGRDVPLPQPRPKNIPGDAPAASSPPADDKPAETKPAGAAAIEPPAAEPSGPTATHQTANVPLPKPRPKAAPERT